MPDEQSLRVMYEARREARQQQAVLRPRRWRRRLIVGGAVLLTAAASVGAYVWWIGTHVRAVRAVVSAALVSLAPPLDMRVRELLVRPGEEVAKGQALVRFDDSEARAALDAAEAEGTIAESRLAQAQAAARRTEMRVNAEIEAARTQIDIAAARVAHARAALEHRKACLPEEIRRAKAECEESRARLQRLTRGPRSEDLETAKVRLSTAKALEEFCLLELEQAKQFVAEGLVPTNTVQLKRAKLIAQQGSVREAELALARLQAGPTAEEMEASRQALAAREAALALATANRGELQALTEDLNMRQAELRQAEAELKRVEAGRFDVTLAQQQVTAATAERKRAAAEIARRRAVHKATTITSPVKGTIHRTFHRQGEVCKKGETTVLVADDGAGRWIEAYVREEDAEYVEAGQRAEVALATGADLRATVDTVALSTSSLARPSSDAGLNAPAGNPSEMVWVRLRFLDLQADPRPGTSARVVIRVR